MKKLAAIMLLMVLLLCGCSGEKEEPTNGSSRMASVDQTEDYEIVYDKDTKVMYAVSFGIYNRGTFTLLVNEDGTPLLYKE